MIVTMEEILVKAKSEKYGVAACNVFNDRVVRSAFEAASELKSPLILAFTPYVPLEELALLSRYYEKKYPDATVALNLDHGKEYDQAVRAIRNGFTSVMLDKSTLPYDENVREVKEVVKLAHAAGVTVEAELGHVGQAADYEETRDSGLTRKEEAVSFVKETGADCLAVAIGTSHGVYRGEPYLDFDLLSDIAKIVDVPLVLHGGSSTGDENLRELIKRGIQKINLATDLATGFIEGAYEYFNEVGEIVDADGNVTLPTNRVVFSNTALERAAAGWKNSLMRYMEVFGSVGKA